MTDKRPSKRERELAAHLHLERYIEAFLKRWSRPHQRFPKLTEALSEIGHERLVLQAELDGDVPSGLRRFKEQ